MFFYQLTVSKGISKVIDHIIFDVCKDCKQKCGLCDNAVCEDVIIEIGSFFLYSAEKEHEEQEKQ